jgi:hypothetical protein
MRLIAPTAFALLVLICTANARIGETAEESVKRYGEEKSLMRTAMSANIEQNKLNELKGKLKELGTEQWMPEKGEYVKFTIGQMFFNYDELNHVSNELKAIKQKSIEDQKNFIKKNFSDYSNLFGKPFTSVEYLAQKVFLAFESTKECNKRIERASLEYPDNGEIEAIFNKKYSDGELEASLDAFNKRAEQISLQRGFLSKLRIYRELLFRKYEMQKCVAKGKLEEGVLIENLSGGDGGSMRLEFEKNGFKIYCLLQGNRTFSITLLSPEIQEAEVFAILQNNVGEGVIWTSIKPEKPIDETNFQVLMKYESSDQSLEGWFGKYRENQGDFGSMRGVCIFEKAKSRPSKSSRASEL